jgi:nucleotide-binding universal stress UspA family protein
VRDARLVTTAGAVERAICEVASEIGVDLILVTTHGRCGYEHLFFGSKAEWIVRHAPCPVMVIPVRNVD